MKSIEARLADALESLVGPLSKDDRYGYGAASNALNDKKRNAARDVLAEYRSHINGDESHGDA